MPILFSWARGFFSLSLPCLQETPPRDGGAGVSATQWLLKVALVIWRGPSTTKGVRLRRVVFLCLEPILDGPNRQSPMASVQRTQSTFKVPEGHHPRGTTLREALRGNLPLRGLCGALSEGSVGCLRGFCGVSAGCCGGPRDFPRFFGGSDPMLVTLRICCSQLSQFIPGPRGTNTTPTNANRAIRAVQRTQGLRGPNSVFLGGAMTANER